jgi:N-acetylneuraminate synthase
LNHIFVIAEAGVNHNGSIEAAMHMVDVAADAGADAVKFQTFNSGSVISLDAPKADYQKAATGTAESQLEMVRKLELSAEDHRRLLAHCLVKGIQFLSTPFDPLSADFLVSELGVSQLKVPSGELTNAPFLLHIASYGLPLIVSTGMSTIGEVEVALGVLAYGLLHRRTRPDEAAFRDAYASDEGQIALHEKVTLLQCTTEYPASFDQVNLRAMDTLSSAFGLPVGLSDHTPGYAIPIAAVARGAILIEKHFTLDREMPGPDHKASLEPAELKGMIEGIRQVSVALGDGRKRPSADEWSNRTIARRSLVAARDVNAGEIWSTKNLTCKRPGSGISPLRFWEYLGMPAQRNYRADELLQPARD